jgi:hypothetical protein
LSRNGEDFFLCKSFADFFPALSICFLTGITERRLNVK